MTARTLRSRAGTCARRLALVAPLIGMLLLGEAGEAAEPDPPPTYAGAMSDGGTIRLTFVDDGIRIDARYGGAQPAGCELGVALTLKPQNRGISLLALGLTEDQSVVELVGLVTTTTAAAGGLTVLATPETQCPNHRAAWSAQRLPSAPAGPLRLPESRQFTGLVEIRGSQGAGTASVASDAAGTVESITLTVVSGRCRYALESRPSTALQQGALTPADGDAWISAVRYLLGVYSSGIGGGFVHPGSGGCPPIAGFWFALTPPAPTPTPEPTAATAGQFAGEFLVPPLFLRSGLGIAQFGGGSVDQLEDAVRRAGAAGVWTGRADGAFVLLIVDGPAFINDGFHAAFKGGLRARSAVMLVR